MFASIEQPTLLGIAAILSALGGILSTVWAIRKGRRDERDKEREDCRKRLTAARQEAEQLAEALHSLKMEKFDE